MNSQSLNSLPLEQILQAIASRSPVPGGGSTAALTVALAAALVAKVAGLGARQPDSAEELAPVEKEALKLAQQAVDLADKDAQAYEEVARAQKLAKSTEKDKATRKRALETSLLSAAQAPLDTAQCALQILALAEQVVPRCPRAAHSDLATGVKLAWTGGAAALFSVDANALAMGDREALAELASRRAELELELEERAAWALAPLEENLRGWLGERDSNPH